MGTPSAPATVDPSSLNQRQDSATAPSHHASPTATATIAICVYNICYRLFRSLLFTCLLFSHHHSSYHHQCPRPPLDNAIVFAINYRSSQRRRCPPRRRRHWDPGILPLSESESIRRSVQPQSAVVVAVATRSLFAGTSTILSIEDPNTRPLPIVASLTVDPHGASLAVESLIALFQFQGSQVTELLNPIHLTFCRDVESLTLLKSKPPPRFSSANTVAIAVASTQPTLQFKPESPSPIIEPVPCVESLTCAVKHIFSLLNLTYTPSTVKSTKLGLPAYTYTLILLKSKSSIVNHNCHRVIELLNLPAIVSKKHIVHPNCYRRRVINQY